MYRSFRYWGFLSYSHDDRRVAERMHKALEAYRIPARLVGLEGPFGPVPARLLPIFRDRDDLKAGGRLGPEVEHALAVSRSLIVLCSPSAATSSWVDAEVAAFIRLQDDGPLFCVILDGEPLASRQGDAASSECLPASVRARFSAEADLDHATPVAVDLREHGDGWRLAVHKIAAGLTGLPLDQLVQRDAQRRHRRMAWLSLALIAVAAALGLLAVLAYRARDEARQQRAQAEGLIEFMLVDLRKRLEPVGRLDVLESVGERALAYYDQQSVKSLDPDSLAQRAHALHLIGEIDDRRGDIKAARSAFTRARASTAELLLREPDQPQRIYDHAQSVFWNGYTDWQYGDIPAAERAFREYARLANSLLAHDSENPDWLTEVSSAHSNLGTLLLEQLRASDAIPQFMQSLRIDRKRATLAGDAAAAQLDIAQDHSWLSSSYFANRQLAQAIAEREADLAVCEHLAKASPQDAVVQGRQMSGYRFLAALQLAAGDVGRARAELARSLAIVEQQRRLDPENIEWQESSAKANIMLARIERMSGHGKQARQYIDAAASILSGQLQRDAVTWEWRVDIQEEVELERTQQMLDANRLQEAEGVLVASQQRLREAALEPSHEIRTLRYRIFNEALQARLARRRSDAATERAHWQQVIALANGRERRLDGETTFVLADAMRSTGKQAAAARLQSALVAAGYRTASIGGDRVDAALKR
ncbi:MAG: toll/interleukin-1 receptor domain-containing protein [Luteimonas sp.]|nr:toll/interleukin-1 receptor domain-containing protein [Luteimonas sp.]